MRTRFDTIKKIALQGMRVSDFLANPTDVSTDDIARPQRNFLPILAALGHPP